MKAQVVIAHPAFGDDLAVERRVLSQIDAEVIHTGTLETPEALAALHAADALMVTLQKVTASVIAAMPRCRVISRAGTGFQTPALFAAITSKL